MLGMAKVQNSTFVVSGDYAVNLSPSSIYISSLGGGASSPVVYSDVVNGIGPFTYLWTITVSGISITSSESANTSFSSGGFGITNTGIATLTVTDTGAGNEKTTRDVPVTFEFEGI